MPANEQRRTRHRAAATAAAAVHRPAHSGAAAAAAGQGGEGGEVDGQQLAWQLAQQGGPQGWDHLPHSECRVPPPATAPAPLAPSLQLPIVVRPAQLLAMRLPLRRPQHLRLLPSPRPTPRARSQTPA